MENPKNKVKIADIKNILATRKGQNLSVVIGKQLKTYKKVLDIVEGNGLCLLCKCRVKKHEN